jgi:hypothetical protein
MIRLIFFVLLLFICSCNSLDSINGQLFTGREELEKFKTSPINICGIDKSSKNIYSTFSIKPSDIPNIKSSQKVERLEIIACFSQPQPKRIWIYQEYWSRRNLYYDFRHLYGLANGYPADKIFVRNKAIKNCENVLSDFYSNFPYVGHHRAICGIPVCKVCEY